MGQYGHGRQEMVKIRDLLHEYLTMNLAMVYSTVNINFRGLNVLYHGLSADGWGRRSTHLQGGKAVMRKLSGEHKLLNGLQ